MQERKNRLVSWMAVGGVLAVGMFLTVGEWRGVSAQGIPYDGQDATPVYEGWRENPDGSFDLMFGYFNRNQEQELHLPVGPNNNVEPGGPDQGQPTHFLPRRNRFLFSVRVPNDFGSKEIVWTLITDGKKNTAYGTLHPDYHADDIVVMNDNGAGGSGGGGYNINDNTAPVLTVEGSLSRTVSVGEPIALAAVTTDDGIPERRVVRLTLPWTEDRSKNRVARIGSRCCADSSSGLRLSWFVYRGNAANVTFDPPQFDTWEDYRDGRDSPWSAGWEPPPVPANNRWTANVTFSEPGIYVVRTLAHDGGLMSWENITFNVK